MKYVILGATNIIIMKKLIFILGLTLFLASCAKFPYDDNYKSPLNISTNFDWKTFETKTISYNGTFSVINQNGDTIATNLPAGEYNLNVAKGTTLIAVPSPFVETKDISVQTTGSKSRIFFPSQDHYSTVMFEDLFPYAGDQDMNDLVIGLNIEYDLNNKSEVLAIHFNIQPRAIGSTKNDIGLAANFTGYPVQVSKIARSSSTYSGISNNHSDLAPTYNVDPKNGYYNPVNPNDAANADYKVAPFTGNLRNFFINATSAHFINVSNTLDPVSSHNFSLQVTLNSTAIKYSNFTFLSSYNATKVNISIFATFDGRGNEVHFKNQLPTKYFNLNHFQIANTDFTCSTPEGYWVWAILGYESVRHPLENVKITNAYPDFSSWVQSQSFTSWYGTYITGKVYTRKNFNYLN